MNVLEAKDLSFAYGNTPVLDAASFTMCEGGFAALVGVNGAGKTYPFTAAAGGAETRRAGIVALMGQDIGSFKSWQRIGYVPQDGLTRKESFPASVNEVVLANLYSRIGLFRFPRREHREDVRRTLELVGMQDYGCRMLGELSGGQRQRVQLAQALVSRPALLLLDEPTAGLDAQSTADFYTLLKSLNRERGLSILIVSHDLQEMPRLTDTIYCLSHQKITRLDAKEMRTYV